MVCRRDWRVGYQKFRVVGRCMTLIQYIRENWNDLIDEWVGDHVKILMIMFDYRDHFYLDDKNFELYEMFREL